ncbi:MAG: hypothetical protein WAN65_15830 [Candidatus Sulfotelmatobacter sp.]
MNCVELQESLAEIDDGGSVEQKTHLRTCPHCSALVDELSRIIAAASELQAADEPSPRVWNSIAIQLRQEGLIRPQARRPLVPSFTARWGQTRWLVPAAAALLLLVGIYVRQESLPNQLAKHASTTVKVANLSGLDDEDLMQEVAANAPAMQPEYAQNLRRVNESIEDAQSAVNDDPNDPEARRALMDAYQQKSMLFEMAMDRP